MNLEQKKWWSIDLYSFALILLLIPVALVRYRFLAMPFERDEGEYAYMGNLILHGGIPYRDAYNMKLPGTYCMYSVIIAAFGTSPTGVHLGFLIVSLLTIVIFYVAFRKLFSPMVALVAVIVYGLLSVSLPFVGFAAHATHFVNLFMAIALWFYARFDENKHPRYAFLTGLMLGLAFLMKQQAAFLIIFAGIMIVIILLKPFNWKKLWTGTMLYSAGVLLPYLILLAVIGVAGAFNKFWFWTIIYAQAYANEYIPDHRGMHDLAEKFSELYVEFKIIWLLALIGLVVVWMSKYDLRRKLFVTLLAIFSFASVCPGYFFRPHYFVVIIPAAGLLTGIALEFMAGIIPAGRYRPVTNILPFVVICLIVVMDIRANWNYYFVEDMNRINKECYGHHPFEAAPEIARYIAGHSKPSDKIGILGNEPEILVYANRLSATGYMYSYPLIEQQKYNRQMQHEMMAEIIASKPLYIVYDNRDWRDLWPNTPRDIIDWYSSYIPANYEQVGLIEIDDTSKYYWNEASNRAPAGENFLKVYRRK